ncbi:MAG TPA: sn-glycerol-3-phosphate ABC transporter ATP-binding protein UgpC [Steroidobacteraceae bacterium]|nr:sn-glycerol-3-phosphate ABC transporter ATP-binding protein UgpC [Steroidobacteraceae bacterium]
MTPVSRAPETGTVEITGLAKAFGAGTVIRSLDLKIAAGEFVVFVGPSGCGKSTLLRLIAGLERADSGSIRISGRDVTREHPARRGIAMVFQSYALYPHMTVAENMGFALRMQGMGRAEIELRVARAAETLQLAELLERRPRALSGGQRQRVAIGRAIVREPDVFLFDEPLSNLDAALRGQMRVEIARLHARLASTMIYVTHDQVEAMTLGTRIVVLNGGAIEQVGAPLELYHRPRNAFVAGFIGAPRMNLLAVRAQHAERDRIEVEFAGRHIGIHGMTSGVPRGASLKLGVRPEHLVVGAGATATALCDAQVALVEQLGGEALIHATAAGGASEALVLKAPGDTAVRAGATIAVAVDPLACHLFDGSGRSLRAS